MGISCNHDKARLRNTETVVSESRQIPFINELNINVIKCLS